jgi:hypothetical protein
MAVLYCQLSVAYSLPSARVDEVADFYKGKTVSVVVAHEAGTGFDVYARGDRPGAPGDRRRPTQIGGRVLAE